MSNHREVGVLIDTLARESYRLRNARGVYNVTAQTKIEYRIATIE
jgi:hypothetical protein